MQVGPRKKVWKTFYSLLANTIWRGLTTLASVQISFVCVGFSFGWYNALVPLTWNDYNCSVIAHPRSRVVTVTRGARGTMSRAPNHWRAPESPNNVASTFFNTVQFLPKDFRFEHGGANLVSWPPRAPFNLGTSLARMPVSWWWWRLQFGVDVTTQVLNATRGLFSDDSSFKWMTQTGVTFTSEKNFARESENILIRRLYFWCICFSLQLRSFFHFF